MVVLIAIITCTVQSFYTLSHNTRRIDRDVQLVGATYFAVSAFVPIPLVLLGKVLPKNPPHVENFGEGRFRAKLIILLFLSSILTLGAAFRAGTAYVPRSRNDPAWYHSKACFYTFNFGIEVVVVTLYAIIRVDHRFIIPDRRRVSGEYSARHLNDGKEKKSSLFDTILSEEQVFDCEGFKEGQSEEDSEGDVEKSAGVVETTDAPGGKTALEEAERNSEKGEGNVDTGIIVPVESEPTPGQRVARTSETEEKAVEAKVDPATNFEAEKGGHVALEERDPYCGANITPALRSAPDGPVQGVEEAPERREGDGKAEVLPILKSGLEAELKPELTQ